MTPLRLPVCSLLNPHLPKITWVSIRKQALKIKRTHGNRPRKNRWVLSRSRSRPETSLGCGRCSSRAAAPAVCSPARWQNACGIHRNELPAGGGGGGGSKEEGCVTPPPQQQLRQHEGSLPHLLVWKTHPNWAVNAPRLGFQALGSFPIEGFVLDQSSALKPEPGLAKPRGSVFYPRAPAGSTLPELLRAT